MDEDIKLAAGILVPAHLPLRKLVHPGGERVDYVVQAFPGFLVQKHLTPVRRCSTLCTLLGREPVTVATLCSLFQRRSTLLRYMAATRERFQFPNQFPQIVMLSIANTHLSSECFRTRVAGCRRNLPGLASSYSFPCTRPTVCGTIILRGSR